MSSHGAKPASYIHRSYEFGVAWDDFPADIFGVKGIELFVDGGVA
jgi:hypothetical protein